MLSIQDRLLMNDSKEYVPSQSDIQENKIIHEEKKIKVKSEESKRSQKSKERRKRKSSKYFNERLSAIASHKQKESESLASSIVNNSVYLENESEYGSLVYG